MYVCSPTSTKTGHFLSPPKKVTARVAYLFCVLGVNCNWGEGAGAS